MNWFVQIIAGMINLLATQLQGLFGPKFSLASVIADNMMSNPNSSFGNGHFSDVLDSKRTATLLGPFSTTFWALGSTFFLVAVYLTVMQITGASNSATQRERMKSGIIGLVVAIAMMWAGQPFAVAVTQSFYYLSLYFLNLGHAYQYTQQTITANGQAALLGSIVNLLQTGMALVVWVIYQFRALFLDVWIVFFPLAMAFFANDKTKGITKMWWTEWIYQMSIPFGQAVVFGIASAMGDTSVGSSVTISEIFTAIAGTVGLLGSAVYMRKLVEIVAQGFGASLIGHSAGEGIGHAMAMGTAGALTDRMAGLGIKGASKATGATVGKALKKADKKLFSGWAEKAIKKNPETHAGMIREGSSLDDIMSHHQMASSGDPLRGVGSDAHQKPVGVGGGFGGTKHGKDPKHSLLHSHSAGAIGSAVSGAKRGFASSNLATAARTSIQGFQSTGGVSGWAGKKLATRVAQSGAALNARGITKIGNAVGAGSQRYLANQQLRQTRLDDLRTNLSNVMENNALASRIPHINEQWDDKAQSFTGDSHAQATYTAARSNFTQALMRAQPNLNTTEAENITLSAESSWDRGNHLHNLGSYTPAVQKAYRTAYSSYKPSNLDERAKALVIDDNKLHVVRPVDLHKNQKLGTQAFLNDARNAILLKR